jgi:hypothetical protein
LSNIL